MVLLEDGLPRTTLDRALEVPRAILLANRSLTRDEVAAAMGSNAGTGAVNARTIAANRFGLIQRDPRGGYRVTDLGRRLDQSPDDDEARRAAIFKVDAFRRLKDHFRSDLGAVSRDDLLQALVSFGVERERAEEAASVFDRSWSKRTPRRSVPPRLRRSGATPAERTTSPAKAAKPDRTTVSGPVKRVTSTVEATNPDQTVSRTPEAAVRGDLVAHPLIALVLAHAPDGDERDPGRRDLWLKLFASAVKFVRPA